MASWTRLIGFASAARGAPGRTPLTAVLHRVRPPRIDGGRYLDRSIDGCQYVSHAPGTNPRAMLSTGPVGAPRGRRRRATGSGPAGRGRSRSPPPARADLIAARSGGVRLPPDRAARPV